MKDPYENVGVTADQVAPLIKAIHIQVLSSVGMASTVKIVFCKDNKDLIEIFKDLQVAIVSEIAEQFGARQKEVHAHEKDIKRGRKPKQ
jgi:hypothetical protein